MEKAIIDMFGAVVEYFALFAFLWIFFKLDDRRRGWRWLCHISMPILFFLFSQYIENMYLRPFLFIFCSWLIAVGFQGNWGQRIFSVSVFQIILIFLEITVSFAAFVFWLPQNESAYLAINIIMKTGTILIIGFLFLVSQKRKLIFANLSVPHMITLLLFSAASLILVSFLEFLLIAMNQPFLYAIGCICILLCVLVNILLYYLFFQLSVGENARERLQFIDFYLSRQKEEQQYLEHAYQEIRKLSHDLNKYLSVVFSLLEQGDINAAMDELKKRQLEVAQNQVLDTGYPVLNSILTYKFQVAQEQGIKTQLFWNLTEPLYVHLTDLAVILSNGLDNAIEAAQQVTEQAPFISVTVDAKDGFVKVRISNNAVAAPVIADGKIVTTKQDKLLHGFGLESIGQLAQKYDGHSSLEYQDYVVTLKVILKNFGEK